MSRPRAANPAAEDPERASEPGAQAALQRILETSPATRSTARRGLKPRGLVLVLAVLGLGVGGALAATDPMGRWSSNPSEAHYRVNALVRVRVRTPPAEEIRCRAGGGGQFRCAAATEHCYQVRRRPPYCELAGTGVPYRKIDAIRAPPTGSVFSRAGFEEAIENALAHRTMTKAQATRFRADLARVTGSFFAELRLAGQYGTYGGGGEIQNGQTRVPPVGQPATLVCTDAGRGFSCRDLNGDARAPIGAGVYSAEPAPDGG